MVDEQYSNIENSQRQNIVNSSSCVDSEMDYNDQGITSNDFNMKLENGINNYDASTSSPESTSENAFNFNSCKYNSTNEDKNGEKKVHWNPSQVHALLDCIEKRMSDFRRKSVHKSVWLAIGKEMSEQGEFSVEHCYNKWKNLRRDIRLFSSTNAMQKLSIRNTYIMERVQRMVNEIGYEGSSRKSSSPISPNFDLIANTDNNNKEFWSVYNSLDQDSRLKLENNLCNYQNKQEPNNNNNVKCEKSIQSKPTIQIDQIPNNNNYQKATINNENIGNSVIEDSIISLLSDPAVSQAIIMNPKLLEEILPGLDFTALMKKFSEAHPELVHIPNVASVTTTTNSTRLVDNTNGNCQFPINSNVSIGVSLANNSINTNHNNNNGTNTINNNNHYNHHNIINNNNNNNNKKKLPVTTNLSSVPHLSQHNDMNNSWPHQLYELLHSFRDEESRQMARLDQIVGYVQVMQESTKRRLSTINQLISLAGLLIPQK